MISLFSKKDYKHIVEYGERINEDLRLKNSTISFFKMKGEYFIIVKITGLFFLSNHFIFNLNDFIDVSKIELDRVQKWVDESRKKINI